ncbi:hypothetical protein NIES22_45740 [Calothrix brevissima NIES-22]|nr:hypothetical protein NIES22_45740 [Calothrix brevissima NIES-22]
MVNTSTGSVRRSQLTLTSSAVATLREAAPRLQVGEPAQRTASQLTTDN